MLYISIHHCTVHVAKCANGGYASTAPLSRDDELTVDGVIDRHTKLYRFIASRLL